VLFEDYLLLILLMQSNPLKMLAKPQVEYEKRASSIRTHIISGYDKGSRVTGLKEASAVSTRQ
jgi:hypothetical protein